MYVTWQTIVTLAAVLAAVFAILKYYNKGYDWVQRQQRQDAAISEIREEQQLLTIGVLACLKGLHDAGHNGPVTEAIQQIEKFLNEKAHKVVQ